MLSVSQHTTARDSIFVFDSEKAFSVITTPSISKQINDIYSDSINNHTVLLAATRSSDGLYEYYPTNNNHNVKLPLSNNNSAHIRKNLLTIKNIPDMGIEPIPLHSPTNLLTTKPILPTTTSTSTTALTSISQPLIDLNQPVVQANASYYSTAELPTLPNLVRFFHETWDHSSKELMCKVIRDNLIDNIPKELTETVVRKHFPHCEACPAANMSQVPRPHTSSDHTDFYPGQELQLDIKYFATTAPDKKAKRAFGNYTGVITAIDMKSRYKIGYKIKHHKDLVKYLELFRVEVTKINQVLRTLRLDNQFNTKEVQYWADRCTPPIHIQPCIPHEHHSIGDIERFNRTLEDAIFKKLYPKHLSQQYWGYAYEDYLMKTNLIGSAHQEGPSPYQQWTGIKPDLKKLPILPFGAIVMAHIPLLQQETQGPRSSLTYVIGTSLKHRGGLLLYNPVTKRIVVRHTYKTLGPDLPNAERPIYNLNEADILSVSKDNTVVPPSDNVQDYQHLLGTFHVDDEDNQLYIVKQVVIEEFDKKDGPIIVAYRRRCKPSGVLLPMTEEEEYPIHIGDIVSMMAHYNTTHSLHHSTTQRIPRSITELSRMSDSDPDKQGYYDALLQETNSFKIREAYDVNLVLDTTTLNKKDIGLSKVIFSKKYRADGTFEKHKCRIVFRGDRWYGHYHNKTYAGTVMSESVKLAIAVGASEDMEFANADIATAFLYSPTPLGQLIYMRRPAGLTDEFMPEVILLQKCVYGLPIAPAAFREHNDTTLKNMGFLPTVSDPRVYIQFYPDNTKAILLVHVDDIGILTDTVERQLSILADLKVTYDIKVSDMSNFLGLHIERVRPTKTVTLTQQNYNEDMMDTYNVPKTNCPSTPMTTLKRPPVSDSNPILSSAKHTLYQQKTGSLLYYGNQTRPDLAYSINECSRHAHEPTEDDMARVDRILHYCADTSSLGLTFNSQEGPVLYATVDASYGSHDDRKSHTGVTLHIGKSSGAFLCRSKKQPIVTDSSAYAEFVAAHLATKEIMWCRSLLAELGYKQDNPTILYEDNMSTIAMINNDCNTQKTKHIEIRFNLIREQVQSKNIQMEYLVTKDMISDILTKPLTPQPFLHLRPKILGHMMLLY